jgi:nicotinamide phosphoribosyltransferase
MGGALLQRVNRDTQEYALKCSYAQVNGKEIKVQKNPLELDANGNTRISFKKSKYGKQMLVKENGVFKSYSQSEAPQLPDELVTVFENGEIKKQYTFDEIKKRAII